MTHKTTLHQFRNECQAMQFMAFHDKFIIYRAEANHLCNTKRLISKRTTESSSLKISSLEFLKLKQLSVVIFHLPGKHYNFFNFSLSLPFVATWCSARKGSSLNLAGLVCAAKWPRLSRFKVLTPHSRPKPENWHSIFKVKKKTKDGVKRSALEIRK